MFDKATATEKIKRQIAVLDEVSRQRRFSPAFKKWHRDTEIAIQKIFGEQTRHLDDFRSVKYNLGAFSSSTPDSSFEERFQKGLADARSVLLSFVQEIDEYWEDEADQGRQPGLLTRIECICDRFHLVARCLRSRHLNRSTLEIEDEYDVQDLLHGLLLVDFDDVRREEWTPSYAGGSARMDFLLKAHKIVVEVKKTRKGLEGKELGDQLLVDIGRYQSHPDCKVLLCFTYDPEGRIGNPAGLESDLSKTHGELEVRVIVAPKGL